MTAPTSPTATGRRRPDQRRPLMPSGTATACRLRHWLPVRRWRRGRRPVREDARRLGPGICRWASDLDEAATGRSTSNTSRAKVSTSCCPALLSRLRSWRDGTKCPISPRARGPIRIRPYVPARYAACFESYSDLRVVDPVASVDRLPAAREIFQGKERTYDREETPDGPANAKFIPARCFEVTTAEALAVAESLSEAGFKPEGPNREVWAMGLHPNGSGEQIMLIFTKLLPHGMWIFWAVDLPTAWFGRGRAADRWGTLATFRQQRPICSAGRLQTFDTGMSGRGLRPRIIEARHVPEQAQLVLSA